MPSFTESWLFLFSITFILATIGVLLTLVCVELWRKRTRKEAVREEVQHIEAEFWNIVYDIAAEKRDK